MKVIHIFNEFKFSGAEIMYVDAAPIFQGKGCELTAVATAEQMGEYTPHFEKAGYKLLHMPLPGLKNIGARIKFYSNFIKHLKKEKYDLVHIHRSDAMWGMAYCAKMAGIRSVYTFHNVFPTGRFTFFYHCLLRFSAKKMFGCKFQTISDSVHQHEKNFFYNETTKVYNWYSGQRYFPGEKEEKARIRKELNINDSALVLISIGGCSHTKRHHDIIKALPEIEKQVADCVYLHLGDGNTKCEEQELAKELGVESKVRFLDNQTDVRKFLVASDIYIMTSKFEGISLTTIESLACRIPAILYNVPGLRDFNTRGENCLLIPEDPQVLNEKVIYLHKNPEVGEKLAERGYQLVTDIFNMNKNAEKIYALYSEN